MPIEKLKDNGPIRHHDFPDPLLIRIQNVWFALRDVLTLSLKDTITNYQRELRPERELEVMERIVSAIQIAIDALGVDDKEIKMQLLKVITAFSLGDSDRVFRETKEGKYDQSLVYIAGQVWMKVVPPVSVSNVEDTGV